MAFGSFPLLAAIVASAVEIAVAFIVRIAGLPVTVSQVVQDLHRAHLHLGNEIFIPSPKA
jgi:hypothetical protein